jgi:hypothetical protein
MRWDARARVLLCYYADCRHVTRLVSRVEAPTVEEISAAIVSDAQVIRNDPLTDVVLIG